MSTTDKNILRGIQICSVVALGLALSMLPDAQLEAEAQEDLYCEMVQLSVDTQGDLGWPDYENKFARVCAT
jgi:hypothetical protein